VSDEAILRLAAREGVITSDKTKQSANDRTHEQPRRFEPKRNGAEGGSLG
jgi:hypothetical protein